MTIETTTPPTGSKIGYVRVSDNDQTEALQVDALKHAGCSAIYGDHGISGSVIQRKGLKALLDDLKTGDTLVVWKLDRLSRSTLHLLKLLDELGQRGVHFQAITQSIDTSNAVGRMIFGQLAVFAEFEREQIRERTKAGMAAAKARGVHIGRPRKLTKAQIHRAAFQIAGERKTLQLVANEMGVSKQTMQRALSNNEKPYQRL